MSWQEKLAAYKNLPQVKPIPESMRARLGDGHMLVPSPLQVEAAMRRMEPGQWTTVRGLAADLAHEHGTDVACVVTTGIFATMVARAADEAEQAGAHVVPYWRTLKADASLNPRYPGGVERQMQRLQAEGHTIEQQGTRLRVQNPTASTGRQPRKKPKRFVDSFIDSYNPLTDKR